MFLFLFGFSVFMFCDCIASHSMSCHCPVCVRLSHSIKDYLLTYLFLSLKAVLSESDGRTNISRIII